MKKKDNEIIFEMLHPGVDYSNIKLSNGRLARHLLFEVAYFVNNALTANVFDYNKIFDDNVDVYDIGNTDKYHSNSCPKMVKKACYDLFNMSDLDWQNFGSGYGKQACREAVEVLYGDLWDTIDAFINFARDNTSIIQQINPTIIEQVKKNLNGLDATLYNKWVESYRKSYGEDVEGTNMYKYWARQMSSLSIYYDNDKVLDNDSIMHDVSKESDIKKIYNKHGIRVYIQIFLHYYTIELYAKAVSQLIMHALEYIQTIQKNAGIVAQQLVTPITPIQLVEPVGDSDVSYTGNAEPINVQNVITPDNLNTQNAVVTPNVNAQNATVNPNVNAQNVTVNPANPIPMDMYNALDDNAKNALAMVLNNPQLRADLEQMGNLLGWNKLLAN